MQNLISTSNFSRNSFNSLQNQTRLPSKKKSSKNNKTQFCFLSSDQIQFYPRGKFRCANPHRKTQAVSTIKSDKRKPIFCWSWSTAVWEKKQKIASLWFFPRGIFEGKMENIFPFSSRRDQFLTALEWLKCFRIFFFILTSPQKTMRFHERFQFFIVPRQLFLFSAKWKRKRGCEKKDKDIWGDKKIKKMFYSCSSKNCQHHLLSCKIWNPSLPFVFAYGRQKLKIRWLYCVQTDKIKKKFLRRPKSTKTSVVRLKL